MKSFKKYLETLVLNPKIITGFATIHKNDDSDKHLPKPPITGFATIHKKDDSDKALKEDQESGTHTETKPDHFHQAYLDHETKVHFHSEGKIHNEYTEQSEKNQKEPFKHHDALNKENSDHEKHLLRYTQSSKTLNHKLVKNEPIYGEDKPIDDTMHHHTNDHRNAISNPTIVHSGVGHNFAKALEGSSIGDKIHMPAYTSTSTRHKTALGFAHEYIPGNGNMEFHRHIIHFHLPKGYHKIRHVQNISDFPSENEAVISKGTKWKKVGYHLEPVKRNSGSGINYNLHHHHVVPDEEA